MDDGEKGSVMGRGGCDGEGGLSVGEKGSLMRRGRWGQ